MIVLTFYKLYFSHWHNLIVAPYVAYFPEARCPEYALGCPELGFAKESPWRSLVLGGAWLGGAWLFSGSPVSGVRELGFAKESPWRSLLFSGSPVSGVRCPELVFPEARCPEYFFVGFELCRGLASTELGGVI
jgi:hypothetical protein